MDWHLSLFTLVVKLEFKTTSNSYCGGRLTWFWWPDYCWPSTLCSNTSKSIAKDLEKAKEAELLRLNEQPIKGSLHELLASAKPPKTPTFDNVALILTPDPRDIEVVDEDWFERRRKPKKEYQEWKF
jgi:hypothetical protein